LDQLIEQGIDDLEDAYLGAAVLERPDPSARPEPAAGGSLICDIQDGELVVLVLQIGHRREVDR
jgi:hypothetical protein